MKYTLPILQNEEFSITKEKLIEFFRELWGIENIDITIFPNGLNLHYKGHKCNIERKDNTINIDYTCFRNIHLKEWEKIISSLEKSLHSPLPSYYVEQENRLITVRKKRRRRIADAENKAAVLIYSSIEHRCFENLGLRIYLVDFQVLVPGVRDVYAFDFTSWNEMSKEELMRILGNWQKIAEENKEYHDFIQYVVTWTRQLLSSEGIVVMESTL